MEIVILIAGLILGLLITNNGFAITLDKITAITNVLGLSLIFISSYCLGIAATLIYIRQKQELK